MEDSYDTDSSSVTNSINGTWSHYAQDGVDVDMGTDAIPVTFIGEVGDDPGHVMLVSNSNSNAGTPSTVGATCAASQDRPQGRETPPRDTDTSLGVQGGKATRMVPSVASLATKLAMADPGVKEPGSMRSSTPGEGTQALRRVEGTETTGPDSIPGAPSWCQRGHTVAGSYGLKHGLTTYKIVPPRAEARCYDRGASLSVGAIEIDELGNLVNPQGGSSRAAFAPSPPGVDTETQPLGKVKEFWRRGSTEKPPGQPTGHSAARGTPTATTAATTATPTPVLAKLPQPSPAPVVSAVPQARGRPLSAAAGQKGPAVSTAEVPFLRPHRRTSSQHVASAIARRIGSVPAPASAARPHSDMEKGPEVRCPEPPTQTLAARGDAAPGRDSEPQSGSTWQMGTRGPGSVRPSRAAGSPQRMPLVGGEDGPAPVHREPCSPPSRTSWREPRSTSQSCGPWEKPVSHALRASMASDPARTLDGAHPVPAHVSRALAPSGTLANGSGWGPEPPHCHIVLETVASPSTAPEAMSEPEGSFPSSIFGPKKKFRPVVQRPVPKDTCLHSALMEAIHAAGGKDGLRKAAEPPAERGSRTLSYAEADSERSALLAAIRGHSGSRGLRKVSSSASAELRGYQDSVLPEAPLPLPAPQASPAPRAAPGLGPGPLGDTADARQALLDAIRSGSGAARLRKKLEWHLPRTDERS
ncbi:protein cordon-bleu-like [Octodon degus]|uniref:Protein cordon-bleu-like n=1 Tax=Octodon degus TaxID=10160 RepID=A0A6P6ECU1_OCTDE|nr:protein cordon-bleu-like [Octodon degus]